MQTSRLIGYERVSTDAQDTALQHAALLAAGCVLIFEEKMSGTKMNRPSLNACLKALQPGDTLLVWKVDRLGRSMLDTALIVKELEERGVGFKSLTQSVDTTNPMGKMMLQMLMMFAEFERNMIVERTQAGLTAARAKGHFGGRRRKLVGEKYERLLEAYHNRPINPVTGRKMTLDDLAAMFGVHRRTVIQWCKHDGEQIGKARKERFHRLHPDVKAWIAETNDPGWGRNMNKRAS